MTLKPNKLIPEWCTTNDPYDAPSQPWDNQPRKVAPGSSVIQGYAPAVKPPVREWNFQLNAIGEWLQYFEQASMRTWVPAGFRPFSFGDVSGEVLTVGFCPNSGEYLYTLNVNQSLMSFDGPNLGDARDKSHVLGPVFPAHQMTNNDSVVLFTSNPPGGGGIGVLQYDGSVVTLRATIPGVTEDVRSGDFVYDSVSNFWVLVGDDSTQGIIFTSNTDGASWIQRTTSASANYIDGLHSVAVNSEGFMVTIEGHAAGTDSFTSPDGITWTKHDNIGPGAGIKHGARIQYDTVNNLFFIVSGSNDYGVHTSPNGTAWTKVSDYENFENYIVIDVQAFGGAWVIVARTSFTFLPAMFLSLDAGQNWIKLGSVPIIQSGSNIFLPQVFKNLNGVGVIASGNSSDTVHFTRNFTT